MVVVLGSGSAAYAAGDAESGKELAYTCLGCHGIESYKNVYPTYSVPELLGQHPEYLTAALKEYRSGERSHITMHMQAMSLSDQDIDDIALYLAGPVLKSGTPAVGTPPAKVAQLCVSCHGADGVGITGDFPTLAGQHAHNEQHPGAGRSDPLHRRTGRIDRRIAQQRQRCRRGHRQRAVLAFHRSAAYVQRRCNPTIDA